MAKIVVALYDRIEEARDAVHGLRDIGIAADHVSLIASDASGEYRRFMGGDGPSEPAGTKAAEGMGVGGGIGAVIGGIGGLLVGLGALAIPGIGPVLAAGPLIATLAGAGAGAAAGGLIGGLAGSGIPEDDANSYVEGVRRGGTLVTATTDDADADRAMTVMQRYAPVDIEQRRAMWRETGWERFDDSAKHWSREEIESERQRHRSASTQQNAGTASTRRYDTPPGGSPRP